MDAKRTTSKRKRTPPLAADTANRPPVAPADDPFFYGWRYVRRITSNGTEAFDQVPLTLEDVLHPEEEDFRVQSTAHKDDCGYLNNVIDVRLTPGQIVLSDCRVDWGVRGLKVHGPDIVVFEGVQRSKEWSTFYVAREKAWPLFVIEVGSPWTRSTDLVDKVEHYYRAGVPFYYIIDADEDDPLQRKLTLIGYRRGKTGYVRIKPDKNGRFLLKPVGLLLGSEAGRACCYHARTGTRIGNYQDVVKEVRVARRAQHAAEERARQLEMELRRLRGKG